MTASSATASRPPLIQDVQGGSDARAVFINQVGVRGLRLPMMFTEGAAPTPASGEWSCYTDLPESFRGTHMSRLVRVLHDTGEKLNFAGFCEIPQKTLRMLPDAAECFVSVKFRAFANKRAPVSGERGYMDFDAAFYAWQKDGRRRNMLRATAPVTSLCPCSKTIAKYGAHNQRSHVSCTLETAFPIRLLDVVALIEESSSCELYSVLKRQDERHVTERAYDNPKFVEDIARDLAVAAANQPGVLNYRVTAENFESIHNHSAYAMVESPDFPSALLI